MEKNCSIYGTFSVTTEGDCEGRSTKRLGTYTGYIDEIAFALADKCCYTLSFEPVDLNSLDLTPKRDKVEIYINGLSFAYNNVEEKNEFYRNLFKDRDVEVLSGQYSGGCILTTQRETLEEKRRNILKKLSLEERKILGLE